MFEAALAKDLEHRVVVIRTLRKPVRREPLDGRQMTAPKEIRQVRREEEQFVPPEVHAGFLPFA